MSARRKIEEALILMIRFKSFVIGLLLVLIFVFISIYAMVTLPYDQAIRMWNSIEYWQDYPKLAFPEWINAFSSKKLPVGTMIFDSREPKLGITKSRQTIAIGGGGMIATIKFSFEYEYDDFPSEIVMWFFINTTQPMLVKVTWIKPDGSQFIVYRNVLEKYQYYRVSGDLELMNRYKFYIIKKLRANITYDITPEIALFAKEDASILSKDTVTPLKGRYRVVIEASSADPNADIDVKLNIYGKVYGLLGTDDKRRDLWIGIMWGAPLALSFGVLASVLTAFLQMIIAATAAWYGGIVDHLISRINEIVMVIPFLPLLIMISYFYKFSIWTLLIVVVALSAFGGGIKTYRAMFLQVKEMPYIEAARAYGASNARIILRYMVPRVLPTIIPAIVLSVPSFVFLEAALAILGVGDPQAITWGKILDEAYTGGALYWGLYHWILAPSVCLMTISIGFALMGFTLDRIFNPRLRER
ncbi:MAG: ABC transporter permease [Thermoprotei archaeon]